MEWIEAKIKTTSDATEIVCALLIENAITGMQIQDDYDTRLFLENNKSHWDYADEKLMNAEKGEAIVTFYVLDDKIEEKPLWRETLLAISNGLKILSENDVEKFGFSLGTLELITENVDDLDWLDNWKKYYKPFTIGKNIIIKPSWEDYQKKSDEEIVLTINPGHVFGTGLHQSTQLCISQLENLVNKNDGIFDIGCGSGILSLTSILLGAKSAVGVDIDSACINVAKENAALNNIDVYQAFCGNMIDDESFLYEMKMRFEKEKCDIVISNIVSDVIIALIPMIKLFVKENGIYITSGIIKAREQEVVDELERFNFKIMSIERCDEWVCVVART